MHRLPLLACATALLTACNSADEAAEQAAPEAVAAVPAPVLVPGAWTVTEDASGAAATFGEAGGTPAMTIACNTQTRAVTLTRIGAGAAPAAYVLEAGGQAARLDMVPSADGAGMTAAIEPGLPIFAAFSDPATAIALTSPAGEKLEYPADGGIRTVLAACA